jgi:hypothetical protein
MVFRIFWGYWESANIKVNHEETVLQLSFRTTTQFRNSSLANILQGEEQKLPAFKREATWSSRLPTNISLN